jgi:AraC-like DNA-binding protein
VHNFLLEFSDTATFLHGPLFWFYTLSLTKQNFRFKKADLLHAIPFASVIIIKSLVSLHADNSLVDFVKLIALLKFISLFIYTIFIFLRVKKYQKSVTHIFSNLENKQLDWLKFLSLGIIVLWLIGILSNLFDWFNFSGTYQYDGVLFQVSVDTFIVVMMYFGFQQKDIYTVSGKMESLKEIKSPPEIVLNEEIETSHLQSIKYQKSGLSEKQSNEIHAALINLLVREEIYKNDDLTLYNLASMLKVTPNHLSQVINSIEGRSFFDLINYHRIEAVKNSITLKEKEHLTIVGIAYECGFNSKAAFNRAFKKFTGLTPTEYKKQIT